MKGERLYSALLWLYPAAFRREYGDAMREAFRALRTANRRSSFPGFRFWLFVFSDVCRSASREQLEACRSDGRRFILRWVGVCTLGVIVTAILANVLSWGFSYLYHPYLEGLTITPWKYGAFLGLGLGIAQSVALGHRVRIGATWILVSVLSMAFGLEIALRAASVAGPVACGIVLGTVVGCGQWLVLRTQTRAAGWWILASASALPVAVLSFATAMHRTLAGMNHLAINPLAPAEYGDRLNAVAHVLYDPKNWAELIVELALVTTSGIVIGALTARSLTPKSSRVV